MLNQITLMGRLTRDPELRYTQNNVPVASFTLAVERDYGSREDRQTDFIDCVAWRHTGEFITKYFQKGGMAAVKGRLQIRNWEDDDGNKRRNAEVIVDSVYFCGGASRSGEEKDSIPADATEGTFHDISDEDGELPW